MAIPNLAQGKAPLVKILDETNLESGPKDQYVICHSPAYHGGVYSKNHS